MRKSLFFSCHNLLAKSDDGVGSFGPALPRKQSFIIYITCFSRNDLFVKIVGEEVWNMGPVFHFSTDNP